MAEVQVRNDSGIFEAVDGARWRVENGVSTVMPAPRASIDVGANVDIPANRDIRIVEGSDAIFNGFTRTGGEYGARGSQRVECRSEAWKILDEEVTVSLTGATDQEVISAALADTERSGDFSLLYQETPISIGDYEAENRQFQIVLRDMMDRTGRVWWFTSDANTLNVQSLGYRGEWEQLETQRDGINVEKWNSGDIATVQNEVRVKGTGSDPIVSDPAIDQTSIDDYGRHSKTYSYRWIQSKAQADDLAQELLIPDPLQNGTVLVSERSVASDTWDNLSNYSITLTDQARGIQSVVAAIEKQVIQEGRTQLHVGRGVGYGKSKTNRDTQSAQDAVRTDYSQMGGTLDDIDEGSQFGKILQSAIDSGRHTLSAAVGDLDNISDGGTFARVRSGNVDADNYVLLATSRGDLDDIDDGGTYGKVLTTAIDAGNIVLAEAVGDIDDIEDGTNFGKVAITNLTPGGAVFATGVELDDGRDLSQITADDGGVTVIDGGEILTGSITANEIDTLDLDAGQLTVGDQSQNVRWEFAVNTTDPEEVIMFPANADLATIGLLNQPITTAYINDLIGKTAEWLPDGSTTGKIVIQDDGGNITFQPVNDAENRVGTINNAWDTMRATAFNVASPEPLAQQDIEELGETMADGGKGKRPVDLEELKKASWYDPPQYVKDEQQRNLEKQGKGDEEDHAVELGHMGNYLLEVTKALAEERDALKEQVDTLESRLDRIEAQLD